jgi:hypothetical protein
MKCEVCPVPGKLACRAENHRPICDDIRNGMPGRARQMLIIATGHESPRTEAETAELTAAMDAEFARHGPFVNHDDERAMRIIKTEGCKSWVAGGCGCPGSKPRVCDRDGERREVMVDECLSCPVMLEA